MEHTVDQWTIADGWVSAARRVQSPNCNDRPVGAQPELIVIHNISLPPGEFGGPHIEALFCNRLDIEAHPFFEHLKGLRVSAHFLIRRDGELLQFVAADQRAWHAGESQWCGRENCNDFSVGIELEGTDELAYSDAQYACLLTLVGALQSHYPALGADAIVGHSDIAPGRKTDPGPSFDWQRLGIPSPSSSSGEVGVPVSYPSQEPT
ncbi:MAG: 1,6-anhydro-N-acetylmuramyl-L-alanine amidase AmpD [Cellvibrionales bacterium]